MFAFVLQLLNGVAGLAMRFLPQSPVQSFLASQAISLELRALGWLNWVVPIHDMLGVFTLWLTAGVIYAAMRYLLDNALSVVTNVSPISGS